MDKVYPHQIKKGTSSAQVLTAENADSVKWLGNVVVLIPFGGTVPPDTPIGAIIVERAT